LKKNVVLCKDILRFQNHSVLHVGFLIPHDYLNTWSDFFVSVNNKKIRRSEDVNGFTYDRNNTWKKIKVLNWDSLTEQNLLQSSGHDYLFYQIILHEISNFNQIDEVPNNIKSKWFLSYLILRRLIKIRLQFQTSIHDSCYHLLPLCVFMW
jgi:hypothetical protein